MAVVPSPKFHSHSLISPVEVSWKETVKGKEPEVGLAVNMARTT